MLTKEDIEWLKGLEMRIKVLEESLDDLLYPPPPNEDRDIDIDDGC